MYIILYFFRYGLIVSDKVKLQHPVFQASRNVFGNDSESDEESNKKPVLLRPSDNINRQAKIAQNKAICEDPTVFQYDEVYDDMKTEKEEKKDKKKEDKKPRYIENLLKSANKRKIENERRIERQIQKEREEEGDQFADKEVFVTTAYKKKLEELKLEEEREKREEYLESIGDVTKQSDLGGFYRHLYEQKLGSEKKKEGKDALNVKDKTPHTVTKEDKITSNTSEISKKSSMSLESSKKRNYRKRKSSNDVKKLLSDGEIEESDEEINRLNLDDIRMAKKYKVGQENIDADSDFSIDESSDEDAVSNEGENTNISKKATAEVDPSMNATIIGDSKTDEKVVCQPKIKIDIWKKRTVGEVFEQALKRYYERKASRGV
ncbi:unnamed protein product [Diatraea saccharalis]|uniref:Nuclear speckle splicing regulatory protein 1 N-terminal domain-containing protein n=1 Tax=Diatraea saccharalis TaxID=40085 RepID=A0A9N9WIK3_9NEOP|nr:unnamed protein product [Diatraea saccharalis]